MVFFKIKVNACILIHPISNYNFLGESFKNTLIYLYYIFFRILQVSNSFDYNPFFFRSPTIVHFFLTPHFVSYTSFFGVLYTTFFFMKNISSYNHKLWSSTTMLNLHEMNQNNKPKAKVCNWNIVLNYEMKFKYDIEVSLCFSTQCSLCLQNLQFHKVFKSYTSGKCINSNIYMQLANIPKNWECNLQGNWQKR